MIDTWDLSGAEKILRQYREKREAIIMFEQDYIMRLIREMVRMILKIVFHIDTDTPTAELLSKTEEGELLNHLLDMVDNGKINEAENKICELTFQDNPENLKAALLFYSYLNDKTDLFLEKNNFSREEVKEGLKDVISRYGLDGLTDMFLEDYD